VLQHIVSTQYVYNASLINLGIFNCNMWYNCNIIITRSWNLSLEIKLINKWLIKRSGENKRIIIFYHHKSE